MRLFETIQSFDQNFKSTNNKINLYFLFSIPDVKLDAYIF